VFRYALEKWPSDPYQAIVFHRGPLSAAQQATVRELNEAGSQANVSVRTIDLAREPDAKLVEIWNQAKGDTLPWVVLRFPSPTGLSSIVWSGALDTTATGKIVNSPARKDVAERLTQGESVVWVFLESGDAKKDDALAEMLEDRLNYLTATLKLPKLEAQDVAEKLVSIPENELKLEFSMYRLSRKDPAEQVFVNMLLGTEPDLKLSNDPVVFPIFGRGRALYALVGKGIKRETIDLAAMFLIGQCSCQVKELNPGTDLLFATDWNMVLKSAPNRDLPVFTNIPAEGAPETVVIKALTNSGDKTSVAPSATNVTWTSVAVPNSAIAGAGVLFVAAMGGIWFFVARRK